ncbi:MAG: hypothetical protein WD848_02950 [Dehalococcoidia bacterium]
MRIMGLLIGLLFGVILIWRDAGDAFLVLLFALLGWLIGSLLWFTGRIINGEVDTDNLRELLSVFREGRSR